MRIFWKVALIPYILEVVQCTGVIESDGLHSMGTLLDILLILGETPFVPGSA